MTENNYSEAYQVGWDEGYAKGLTDGAAKIDPIALRTVAESTMGQFTVRRHFDNRDQMWEYVVDKYHRLMRRLRNPMCDCGNRELLHGCPDDSFCCPGQHADSIAYLTEAQTNG